MKRANVLGAALVIAGTVAATTPGHAQATIGWDAALFNAYVWRGVTYTNKPVFQPDVYLTFPVGSGAAVTVGGWGNIDLGKYDGATDIKESGKINAGSFNFAEFDYWGEINAPVGKATLTGGITGYFFPNPASSGGFNKAFNTTELYGKVALGVPLSPKLAMWYDVDKVKGAYFEGSIAHSVPVGTASLNLGLLAGLSAGQGCELKGAKVYPIDCTATPSWNFAGNDLTHVDLSAAIPFTAGVFTIAPSAHAVYLHDTNDKFTNAANSKDFKGWFGVTISWSKALGAAPPAATDEPTAPAATEAPTEKADSAK
jgi:hypothetical protein